MTSDLVVRHLKIRNSTFRGIMINGPRAKILNNKVSNTGGTTVFNDAFAIGIEVFGPDCDIAGNTIEETYPVGIGEGIGVSASSDIAGCVIHSNRIVNARIERSSRIFGVWIDVVSGKSAVVEANEFLGLTYSFVVSRDSRRLWPDNFVATFRGNMSTRIDCSPVDLPMYYRGLDPTNTFNQDIPGCSDTVTERLKRLNERGQDDGRALYALAISLYDYVEGGPVPTVEEYWIRVKAIELLEKSASLGVEEARRVLPGVRAMLRSAAIQFGLSDQK